MNPIFFNSWAIPNIQASGESEMPAIKKAIKVLILL